MDWVYLKGGEKDFDGAPAWSTLKTSTGNLHWFLESKNIGFRGRAANGSREFIIETSPNYEVIIAERTPRIGYDLDLEFCKENPRDPRCVECDVNNPLQEANKYQRACKGVMIDVYDVLQAWSVTNPALQHLIKKALCPGERGHKGRQEDLQDVLDSAKRAIELERQ
jgi:hypothetical protein